MNVILGFIKKKKKKKSYLININFVVIKQYVYYVEHQKVKNMYHYKIIFIKAFFKENY